ncbi:hypothetical protein HHI36_013063 [Cryptolaemus montrouzieri]|uniref:Uncharacterized protein n=1 Tax=Cryptolaemus montrouzieri TaxID=559131 RepID=A0ABD2NGQ1_9CUCU
MTSPQLMTSSTWISEHISDTLEVATSKSKTSLNYYGFKKYDIWQHNPMEAFFIPRLSLASFTSIFVQNSSKENAWYNIYRRFPATEKMSKKKFIRIN